MLAEPDLYGVEPGSPEHLYSLGQVAAQAAVLRSPPCQHPNIVALVGEVPDDQGRAVKLLYEIADHGDLERYILRTRSDPARADHLSVRSVLGWLHDIAAGLAHMHAGRLMHRNLKPNSMLVFPEPLHPGGPGVRVKLASMGEAKLADDGRDHIVGDCRVGAMLFMAPEAVADDVFHPASDVYSWAVTACCTIGLALGGPDSDVARAHRASEVVEAGLAIIRPLSPMLAELLTLCVAREHLTRPTSAQVRDRVGDALAAL